ncbi:MAG: hypothetical protein J6P64_00440 [Bacteroidales bacterium]|jgi:hypothetical protein|nr:hypothetical protein [Bacteroidales bacterium]
MKKKLWITILIIIAAAGVAFAVYYIWFADHKKYYQPEVVEPPVFHDIEFDTDLLIGVWKEEDLYYRYNDDGTAVTWDLADDVLEDEGTELDWTLEHNIFTHYYKMEIGGVIPKIYNMRVLELDVMEYDDDYGVSHKFSKVDEELIN